MLPHTCLFFTCLLLAAPQQPNQPSAQGTLVIEERSTDIPVRTPDPQVRYRLVRGGFISRTTDGGATWNGQLVSANAELAAGSAPAPNVCWVVGAKGTIYRTTDGVTWKKVHAHPQPISPPSRPRTPRRLRSLPPAARNSPPRTTANLGNPSNDPRV